MVQKNIKLCGVLKESISKIKLGVRAGFRSRPRVSAGATFVMKIYGLRAPNSTRRKKNNTTAAFTHPRGDWQFF
jgi:hypothetical protein